MAKDNNCALCGCQLEARGKPKVEYEVRQYGKQLRKVCKPCLGHPTQPTQEEKKK